jgi:hypothetical protein
MTSQVEYTETHVVFHVPEGAFRLDAALFSQSGVLLREQVFFGLSVIFSEPEDESDVAVSPGFGAMGFERTGGAVVTIVVAAIREETIPGAIGVVFLLRSKYGNNYIPPAATGIFADVSMTYWAANWIEQLYTDGITRGCAISPLEYCPENNVTRAEMAVFLIRSKYGSGYTSTPATEIFADVPTTYWVAGWINQLVSGGITSGCGSGDYCPENPVSRAQMASFLVRAFNLP